MRNAEADDLDIAGPYMKWTMEIDEKTRPDGLGVCFRVTGHSFSSPGRVRNRLGNDLVLTIQSHFGRRIYCSPRGGAAKSLGQRVFSDAAASRWRGGIGNDEYVHGIHHSRPAHHACAQGLPVSARDQTADSVAGRCYSAGDGDCEVVFNQRENPGTAAQEKMIMRVPKYDSGTRAEKNNRSDKSNNVVTFCD
jgi:hypothetical protein